MPHMRMNRAFRLATTEGHVIVWEKKDDIQMVPEPLVEKAVMYGAEVVDKDYKKPEPVETKAKPEPTGHEREKAIKAAMSDLVAKNDSRDFGASGAPTPKAIEKITGFSIDTKERNAVWDAFVKENNSMSSGS